MSSSAKWVSAQALHLNMDGDKPSSTARRLDDLPVRVGGNVTVSRLTNGTEGGRSVAVFQIDFDDGSTVMFETSVRLLDSAVRAFKARDEAEGRPQ